MTESIKSKIRTVPNWPKKGIMFKDVTTLIKNSEGFKETIDHFFKRYKDKKIDKVVGIESRGFIFGAPLAYLLGCGFVIVRKPGKLPAECVCEEYTLEYGTDKIEVHKDAIEKSLYQQEKDLFNLQETVTLYDITNTYFEGRCSANPKALYGRSKEKRSDCPLVSLGMVLDASGFPKKSKIYNFFG